MSTFLSRIAAFAVALPLVFGAVAANAGGHGKHKKDIVDTAVPRLALSTPSSPPLRPPGWLRR